jgi:hypothetical protein
MRRWFPLLLFLFLLCPPVPAFAKNSKRLETLGTVIGYERLFGHIYDSAQINDRLLLIRIDKVARGSIDSQYLLVNYFWRLEDKNTPIDRRELTQWNFSLTKDDSCKRSMREAEVVSYTDGGVEPRFLKMPGVKLTDFKFDAALPCYQLKRGGFSFVQTFPAAGHDNLNNSDQFFLEKDIWKNYRDAPVQINVSGGGGTVAINNVSGNTVVSYLTACVENEETLAYKFSGIVEEKEKLPPGIASFNSNSDGTNSLKNRFGACYRKNAHLTVIKVFFEDGSAWALK